MRAMIGKIFLWFIIGTIEAELGKEALNDFRETMRETKEVLADLKKRLGSP